MQLPTTVFSHCLAHGVKITPGQLTKNLAADQRLGYGGMVILPLLMNQGYSPNDMAKPFKETGMKGLICGLIPGDGPSPFDQPMLVLKSLRRQARFATKLADQGLGSPVLAGPLHTHHRQPRPSNFAEIRLCQWLDTLTDMLREYGLTALFEPLNPTEDKTPQPFQTLQYEVLNRAAGLQYDTGHAHSHQIFSDGLIGLAPTIGYFEFANVGRWPLDDPRGINFETYVQAMAYLPDDCLVGVEPFDQTVIQAFGLETLCATTVPGQECLVRDAAYLQKLGVMAKPT